MLNSVVLPAPFGPMTALISPARMVKSRSAMACNPPNRQARPRTSRSDAAFAPMVVVASLMLCGRLLMGGVSAKGERCCRRRPLGRPGRTAGRHHAGAEDQELRV